jgi:uncharacterized protein (TIRG00374 family)
VKRVGSLLIGLLAFTLWFHYVGPREMWRSIQATHLGYFAIGFVFIFISHIFRIVRWQLIIRPLRAISFQQVSKYYWASEYINNFMPLRLGEISKIAFLKKDYGIDAGESLSTIAVDRLYGIVIRLVVLGALPLLAINLYPILKGYLIYAVILTTSVLLLLVILLFSQAKMVPFVSRTMRCFLPTRWVERTIHFLETSLAAVAKVHVRKLDIALFLVLSVLGLVAQALRTYFFFRAVALHAPWTIFLVTTTISDFLAILPSPPASLGTTEWYANIVYTFGLGMSKSDVGGISLLTHAVNLCILGVLGMLCFASIGQDILLKESPVSRNGSLFRRASRSTELQA